MLGVEGVGHLGDVRLVDRALGGGDPHLEGLADVAHVDRALEAVLVGGEALLGQRLSGPAGEVVEDALHRRVVERGLLGDVGLDVVVLHVDGQQAEGADVAGVGGHDHAGEVEDVDEPARQQRPRAAERGEHEVAHVEAALDRDLAQRVGLVPGGDLQDAGGAALEVEAELVGEVGDTGAGGLHVERDLAAEEVGRDPAEHDVRVGDRRLGAALAVAERARVGAGRVRPDLEGALRREPRDRPAAGTDGDDVDHRDLAGIDPDRALRGEGGLAVQHDRHVGGGAAAVAGEDLGEPRDLRDQRGPERAGGRPGQHRRDRLVHHLVGRQHAAVGLHHVERDLPGSLPAGEGVQPLGDVGDVARDVGLDRGVDQRRHRALVLAVLAQHLARDRHDRVGVLAPQHLAQAQLVLVVGVRVEQADADRGDPLVAEPARGRHRGLLVEGAELGAGEVEAAADGADPVGRDDAVRLDPEVGVAVAVGHGLAGDLEHELVALGGDEAERLHLALEQLVGGDRGAVRDRGDVAAVGADDAEDLLDARDEAVGRVARRAGCLGGDQLARVLVEGHHVGERATGVDADPDPPLAHGCDSTDPGLPATTAIAADERAVRWQKVDTAEK